MLVLNTKRCCTCKAYLPKIGFGPDKTCTDGLFAQCRECANKYKRNAYKNRKLR